MWKSKFFSLQYYKKKQRSNNHCFEKILKNIRFAAIKCATFIDNFFFNLFRQNGCGTHLMIQTFTHLNKSQLNGKQKLIAQLIGEKIGRQVFFFFFERWFEKKSV